MKRMKNWTNTLKKQQAEREESEQALHYEVKIAKRDKADEKEKLDIKSSKNRMKTNPVHR